MSIKMSHGFSISELQLWIDALERFGSCCFQAFPNEQFVSLHILQYAMQKIKPIPYLLSILTFRLKSLLYHGSL